MEWRAVSTEKDFKLQIHRTEPQGNIKSGERYLRRETFKPQIHRTEPQGKLKKPQGNIKDGERKN